VFQCGRPRHASQHGPMAAARTVGFVAALDRDVPEACPHSACYLLRCAGPLMLRGFRLRLGDSRACPVAHIDRRLAVRSTSLFGDCDLKISTAQPVDVSLRASRPHTPHRRRRPQTTPNRCRPHSCTDRSRRPTAGGRMAAYPRRRATLQRGCASDTTPARRHGRGTASAIRRWVYPVRERRRGAWRDWRCRGT
jgi:hypothetical protein